MKVEIRERKIHEVSQLVVKASVRYWDDAEVNGIVDTDGSLIPFRKGDCWNIIVDVDKGQIVGWPKGTTAKTHYKVCDCGLYSLVNSEGVVLFTVESYVPDCLGDEGDYLELEIDSDGFIKDWVNDFWDIVEIYESKN